MEGSSSSSGAIVASGDSFPEIHHEGLVHLHGEAGSQWVTHDLTAENVGLPSNGPWSLAFASGWAYIYNSSGQTQWLSGKDEHLFKQYLHADSQCRKCLTHRDTHRKEWLHDVQRQFSCRSLEVDDSIEVWLLRLGKDKANVFIKLLDVWRLVHGDQGKKNSKGISVAIPWWKKL